MYIQYMSSLIHLTVRELWMLPGSQWLHRLSLLSPVAVLCFCLNIMRFPEQKLPVCLNVSELYLV